MPYMRAGIDVHKKMLAVVVTDVEVVEEYQFERRYFVAILSSCDYWQSGCLSGRWRKS